MVYFLVKFFAKIRQLNLGGTVKKICLLCAMILPNLAGQLSKDFDPKDLGTFGEVFPIQEKNLIDVIKTKLLKLQEEGMLDSYNQKIQTNIKNRIERPAPVKGVTHTTKPRTFIYNPSITLIADLKDTPGTVFHRKGEKINPLHYRSMTKPLLFIDGDESIQISWAFSMLKKYPLAKIVLVKGAPLKIMEEVGLSIYFDQYGKITQKLGIKQVPAIVTQDKEHLKIEEVKADAGELVEMRLQETAQKLQNTKKKLAL